MIGIAVGLRLVGGIYFITKKRAYYIAIPIIISILFVGVYFGLARIVKLPDRDLYASIGLSSTSMMGILLAIAGIFYVTTILFAIEQGGRFTIPLEQLPEEETTTKTPFKQSRPYTIIAIAIIGVYFAIGAIMKYSPHIPPEQFEKTRINKNLSDDKNGYVLLSYELAKAEEENPDMFDNLDNCARKLMGKYEENYYNNSDYYNNIECILTGANM